MQIWRLQTPVRTIRAMGNLIERECTDDAELRDIARTLFGLLSMRAGEYITFEITSIPKPGHPLKLVTGRKLSYAPDNGGFAVEKLTVVDVPGASLRIITDWAIIISILLRRRRVPKSPMYPRGYVYGYNMTKAYMDGHLYYWARPGTFYMPLIPHLQRLRGRLEGTTFPNVLKAMEDAGIQLYEPEDGR